MSIGTYLADVAEEILTSAKNALSPNRTGNLIPHRTNTAWGVPPADECCEGGQLTVHIDSQGLGGGPVEVIADSQFCSISPYVTYVVTLYRCVPVGDDVNELTTSARELMTDLWALLKGIIDDISDGTLYTGAGCHSTKISNVEIIDPDGACAGMSIYITILVNDPGPE